MATEEEIAHKEWVIHRMERIIAHSGPKHKIECVWYGDPIQNAAVECVSCGEVIIDFDHPDMYDDDDEEHILPDPDGDCPDCGEPVAGHGAYCENEDRD